MKLVTKALALGALVAGFSYASATAQAQFVETTVAPLPVVTAYGAPTVGVPVVAPVAMRRYGVYYGAPVYRPYVRPYVRPYYYGPYVAPYRGFYGPYGAYYGPRYRWW